MTLVIAIEAVQGTEPIFAIVTITTIADRTAVDFAYTRNPTAAEIELAERGVTQFLQSRGDEVTVVDSAAIQDPAERHRAIRKFLGGGQG